MRYKAKHLLLYPILASLFALVAFLPAPAQADNIVQGFNSKSDLPLGTIVRLSADSSSMVEPVPGGRADLIFGVVVNKDKAPLSLDRKGATTSVASQGKYTVLVSDEKGPIEVDDYISISSSEGVGAKSDGNQSVALGKAVTAFDGQQEVIGKAGQYNLGKISVYINIARNPDFKNTLAIPQPLQKIGNSIAGREVSPLRIYISLIFFTVGSVLTLVLLIVGTRGGLVAIGRNPLSKHTITKAMYKVISLGGLIFIASLLGVYLLLRL